MTQLTTKNVSDESDRQKSHEAQFTGFCSEVLDTLVADARTEFANFAGEIIYAASKVKALQNGGDAENSEDVSRAINALVMKMQFSDRFCQRLENVQQSIDGLTARLNQQRTQLCDDEWQLLLSDTRELFTTEQERYQFDQYFDLKSDADSTQAAESESEDFVFFD